MLLTLPAAAVAAKLLWRYYGEHPDAEPVDIPLAAIGEPPSP